MKTFTITARYTSGGCTYVARSHGKTATCTSGPEGAARALAGKLWGSAVRSLAEQPQGSDLFSHCFNVQVDDQVATQGARA